jgi:cell division protein FtsB
MTNQLRDAYEQTDYLYGDNYYMGIREVALAEVERIRIENDTLKAEIQTLRQDIEQMVAEKEKENNG